MSTEPIKKKELAFNKLLKYINSLVEDDYINITIIYNHNDLTPGWQYDKNVIKNLIIYGINKKIFKEGKRGFIKLLKKMEPTLKLDESDDEEVIKTNLLKWKKQSFKIIV